MKGFQKVVVVFAMLFTLYYFGPNPAVPKYRLGFRPIPNTEKLDSFIEVNEAKHKIKPNNQARIVWANDSVKEKTEYSIVYLHGFSASQEEGNPVHRNIAKAFGCNLFLSRLAEHGIDTAEQLKCLTVDKYWESAKEAFVVGKKLGNKVILMGTSTGASMALQLAATYPNDVAGLILYSPNIEINDPNAWILNNNWGLQIARLVKGSYYNDPSDERPIYKQYWNKPYRLEAVVQLQEMIETAMHAKTFKNVRQPTLLLYYYKDAKHQDNVVKVSAMHRMFNQLATPKDKKVQKAMPLTENHVLASPIKSKDVEGVERETKLFMQQILNMQIVADSLR
jgi:esterase/lipase